MKNNENNLCDIILIMDRQVKEKLRIALIFALNAGFMDGFSFFHFNDRLFGHNQGMLFRRGLILLKEILLGFGILQFRLSSLY
ncbi:hypothetical protein ICE98_01206 [Lactococcus lactis]|nr:hypothetical protein [Lactococcus lactis]